MASKRVARALLTTFTACAVTALSGCAETQEMNPLERAIATNESRHVAERFEERPMVVDDTQGVATLRLFFKNSETLVVSDATEEAQLRAASIAVAAHAPMIVYDPARHQEISREIERLHTHTVLTVGDVAVARTSGRVRVYRDPGGLAALGVMMAVRFDQQKVADPSDAVAAVAALNPRDPTWLRAEWAEPAVMPGAEAKPFPIMSRRDAQMAPVVVATADSSIASVANARSFGADVVVVDNPDPRRSEETLFAMAGLADLPLVALGAQFGPDEKLRAKIIQAEESYLAKDGDTPAPAH